MIIINGSVSTGSPLSLTCVVGVVEGLVVQPTIMWTKQYEVSQSIIGQRMENNLTLQFNFINTSDAGQYTCTAGIKVENINLTVSNSIMTNITLQSKVYSSMHVTLLQSKSFYTFPIDCSSSSIS